jgi:hypothetical protein
MSQYRIKIINEGLSEEGLPIQAFSGIDPGHDYFVDLVGNLQQLFDELQGEVILERELSHALYCLGRHVGVQYKSWMKREIKMRENLMDDIFRLETAVESIFNAVWIPYD